MDSTSLTISSSFIFRNSSQILLAIRKIQDGLCFERNKFSKIFAVYPNGSASGVRTFQIGYVILFAVLYSMDEYGPAFI